MGLIKKGNFKTKKKAVTLGKKSIDETSLTSKVPVAEVKDRPSSIIPPQTETKKAVPPSIPSPTPVQVPQATKDTAMQQLESEMQTKRNALDKELSSLKQNTNQELDKIKQAAKDEGINIGKLEAKEEYTKKSQEIMETLSEAVKLKNKIIKEAESGILKLSIKIAEQIIRSEISLNQAVCLNIVSEAINKITDRDQVIIKVNNLDLELVKRNRDRLSGLIDGVKSFSIVEDNSVDPGGCIVETNLGYIDARIVTRLDAVEAALLKVQVVEDNVSTPNQTTPTTQEED